MNNHVEFKNHQDNIRIGFTEYTDFLQSVFAILANATQHLETDIIITSINDHKHRENSKHYQNLALDIRISNLTNTQRQYIIKQMGEAGYRAILEATHIHVEATN